MRCGTVYLVTLAALAAAPGAFAQSSPHPTRERRARSTEAQPPWWKFATFRVMGGAANLYGASAQEPLAWTLDVHAGLRLLDPSRSSSYWIFGGDVGLSVGPRAGATRNLWLGGLGLAYGNIWFSLGWSPRFVFGDLGGSTALGLRNTVSACMFLGFACLDASHQYLASDSGDWHDLRLSFGLDLGMLAQVIVQFARTRPG